MSQLELSVSIVLFKTDEQEILNVIRRLKETELVWKLLLIDNSPTNNLQSCFQDIDQVEYVFTGKNLGFGKAHNIAIEKIKKVSNFHLIINSDLDFEGAILDEIIYYMKQHSEVGLLAPKVLNMDGTLQYSAKLLPRPVDLIVRRFLPIKVIQNYFNDRFEFRFFTFDKIIQAPCFTGCFLMINTSVFTRITGFDERFFMYSEDIDLTRRINKHYKTLYYPHVSIYHHHGKGSYKNLKLLYYHIKSMILYFNKWGWFYDIDRIRTNRETISKLRYKMNQLE